MIYRVVIDSNVVVTGLRSSLGASNKLLYLIGMNKFEVNISVPLVIEYEKVLFDPNLKVPYTKEEITKILDYFCANSRHVIIHYLWRPYPRGQVKIASRFSLAFATAIFVAILGNIASIAMPASVAP